MNRTDISWVRSPDGSQGFTSNPVRGKCLHNCPYCYAETIRKRYKQPANISWHPSELDAIRKRKKPATIFMGSMHDLFGEWIRDEWLREIKKTIVACPQHFFLFLTKNAARYPYLTPSQWPENIYWGHTNEGNGEYRFTDFISFEPFIHQPAKNMICSVNKWLIIGSLNKNGKPVPIERGGTRLEWVTEIINEADRLKIPIFIKPELAAMYPTLPKRQEIPYLAAGS